jgi:alpha-L-fucosidase
MGHKKNVRSKICAGDRKKKVSVLGQNDLILEYQPGVSPKTVWTQKENGLHITVTRAQRIYNDRTWPNPVVLKITNAK